MINEQEAFDLGEFSVPVEVPMPRCVRSPKQAAIVAALRVQGVITLTQATELIGRNVYCNQKHYTGLVLANMVKRGLIRRVKAGVFQLP